MSMFMRVEMSNVDTGALKFLHLSKRLAFDLLFANPTQKQRPNKVNQRWSEVLAIHTHQRWNTPRIRDRNTIGQNNMATYAKLRIRMRNSNGIVESRASGHQRGRRKRIGVMQLCNGPVDALG